MKRLLLVTSPPACGKSYISVRLAEKLQPMVFLDKDTLIILSRQIFKCAGEPFNRSSDFFQQNVRDYEYECVEALAFEALNYAETCLINAPFTQEVRDRAFMKKLRAQLAEKGAILTVVWVKADPETVHKRMVERNSDRDTWKIEHWDEYNAGVDYSIPETLNDPEVTDEFFIIDNNGDDVMQKSMQEMIEKMHRDDEAAR